MNLDDAMACLWLVKSHWANFTVLTGEKLALQAGAWLDVLGDVELPDIRVALAEIDVEGGEFAPTPGQVRQVVLRRRGLAAPDFDQAHAELLQMIRRYGPHTYEQRPPWSHPAIGEAVKAMGGYFDVCNSKNTDAWRAQFRNAYEAAAKRADREAMAPPAARELHSVVGELAEAMAVPELERGR